MKNFVTLIILILLSINTISQKSNPPKQQKHDIVYEKVYLHVDREVYSPGEDIWFKIYLVSGINNKLIQGYKNVYIQLVDTAGIVVENRLLLVINGVATGDFQLSGKIQEGEYTIRAFTTYLKNFDEESFFHKKIWVSQMKQKETLTKDENITGMDISFLPESGNLILNAPNTIAFKAINTEGRGMPVSGYIIDDLGDTITPFETEFMGMGKFLLMPKEGKRYYARLNSRPNFSYEFTDIVEDGVALNFINGNSEFGFEFARNYKIIQPQSYTIEFSHKGNILFIDTLHMDSYLLNLSYAKEKFPLGITKVSVKDAAGYILAERIIFIEAGFEDMVELIPDKKEYASREKVTLDIQFSEGERDSISGGLSLAVINKNYLNRDGYSKNIRSYLLLDSELKGPVESSASYFTDTGIKSSEKLNLLMMVQGWRRYYWPDIIAKIPSDLKGWDDYGLTVEGRVKRLFFDEFVYGGKVRIGPFSSAFTFVDTVTSSSGYFKFDRLYLRDSTTLIIEARTKRGKRNTEIFLYDMYIPDSIISIRRVNRVALEPIVPRSFYYESFTKAEADRRYAIEHGTNWIEEVTIFEQKPLSFGEFERRENIRINGYPDKSITVTEDDNVYFNVFDYLESNPVGGISVMGEDISVRGSGPPLYLLDGLAVSSSELAMVHMGDIEYIDIKISGIAMASMGSRGGNGVIAVYSRHGSLSDFRRYVKGRLTKEIHGYQWPREFYSPKYTLDNIYRQLPDYRPTLFWEPFVFLKNNKASVEFFTSDFLSDYIVIVEGISAEGKICTGLAEFSVKK